MGLAKTAATVASTATMSEQAGENRAARDQAAREQATSVPALEAAHLALAWGDGREVVRDISLAINPGEVCCLVGRSGCGKTTLLHALAGLLMPQSGSVLLHGEDVTGMPGRIGYMLQKDLLLPHKRIVDNVALPLVLQGVSRREARARAQELLARMGLGEVAQSWPSELSGGMRQRAAFLRTSLTGTDVILLDEPFSALDALTRREMREWLMDAVVEMNMSALVITHDVDEAVSMASHIFVMRGNPAQGVVTKIVGEVVPKRPLPQVTSRDGLADTSKSASPAVSPVAFELTDEFLAAKREVLALCL